MNVKNFKVKKGLAIKYRSLFDVFTPIDQLVRCVIYQM